MSNLVELRQIAKNLNVKGHSVLKKADLISAIEKAKAPAAVVEAPAAVVEVTVAESPVKPTKEKKIKPASKVDGEASLTLAQKAPRKANEWNSFLNDYRKEKGLSLRQAMSEAKTAYAELKSKPKEM